MLTDLLARHDVNSVDWAEKKLDKNEPRHDKTNKVTVRPASAQSDQSSLCAQWVAKDPSFLHVDSEDSDQTGWTPRLIWVFAGRTDHFVSFVKTNKVTVHPAKTQISPVWSVFAVHSVGS